MFFLLYQFIELFGNIIAEMGRNSFDKITQKRNSCLSVIALRNERHFSDDIIGLAIE